MEVGDESDGMGIPRRWRVRYDATSKNPREAEGKKAGKADQSKVAAAAGLTLDVLYLQPETRRARGAARVMALVGLCLLSCAAVCCRTVRRVTLAEVKMRAAGGRADFVSWVGDLLLL